jgi:hypothetical protein
MGAGRRELRLFDKSVENDEGGLVVDEKPQLFAAFSQ